MLIGLSGKSRCGKSTAAKYMVDHYGFTRVSFAKALKEKVKADFYLTQEQVYGDSKDVIDPRYQATPRDILIDIGNLYRKFDKDYWVKLALRDINPEIKDYVIDDLRFTNEAVRIVSIGGWVVRISRPGVSAISAANAADVSETDLDNYKWHYVIETSTIEDFYVELDRMLTAFGKNRIM